MPSNTENVKLGVCTVTFDGVDLGYTKGGVEVEVSTESKKITVDQFGTSPINEIIMGRDCKVKVPLAETTMRNLARIMPGAVLTESGGAKATGTVTFDTSAPSNGDSVTVNGVIFAFKTSPAPGTNEMAVPGSVNAAASALAAKLNASTDPKVSQITASAALGVVTITADDNGTHGNLVTLVKSGTNIAVSGATLSGGADVTAAKVAVPNGIGLSLLSMAKALVLHPQGLPPEDKSEDFTVPLAMTPGGMNFSYKFDDERVFNCEFTGYPDPVTKVLYVYGDTEVA